MVLMVVVITHQTNRNMISRLCQHEETVADEFDCLTTMERALSFKSTIFVCASQKVLFHQQLLHFKRRDRNRYPCARLYGQFVYDLLMTVLQSMISRPAILMSFVRGSKEKETLPDVRG